MLRDAGLSKRRSQVYTALLQLGTASATGLADESGVPTARIYDVLRDLEEKGYVETYNGDTLRARASEPASILSESRRRSGELSEATDETETRWEAPALEHAREVIAEAETEVQVPMTPENVDALRESSATAHDNGAIVKASIHAADGNEEVPTGYEEISTEYEGVATDVRHRMLPTSLVAIVDRTVTGYDGPDRAVLGGVDA